MSCVLRPSPPRSGIASRSGRASRSSISTARARRSRGARKALQCADRAGLCVLDSAVRHPSRSPASPRSRCPCGGGVPVAPGHRGASCGVDTESSIGGAALSVRRRAPTTSRCHRRYRAGAAQPLCASRPVAARGADADGQCAPTDAIVRGVDVRRWPADFGVRLVPRQGHRSRPTRDPGAQRQGWQGSPYATRGIGSAGATHVVACAGKAVCGRHSGVCRDGWNLGSTRAKVSERVPGMAVAVRLPGASCVRRRVGSAASASSARIRAAARRAGEQHWPPD